MMAFNVIRVFSILFSFGVSLLMEHVCVCYILHVFTQFALQSVIVINEIICNQFKRPEKFKDKFAFELSINIESVFSIGFSFSI